MTTGSPPPWLADALAHMGEHEILGKADNQFILDCFKYTNYKASHDEVPWCAAFVSRMLEESGYKSEHSAWAQSYEKVGQACELKPGAILVFKWANGDHHVSICHHIVNDDLVACVGGNQSNMVKMSIYSRKSLVSIRWPDPKV